MAGYLTCENELTFTASHFDKDKKFSDSESTADSTDVGELEDTLSELPETPLSLHLRKSFGSELPSEVKLSDLEFNEMLHRGINADVFRAVWTRRSATEEAPISFAVKMLHAGIEVQRGNPSTEKHQNVAQIFDVGQARHLCVTEYCAGGSLFDLVHVKNAQLSWKQRVKLLLDIATAMEELHSDDIIHGRLKASNVLIEEPFNDPTQELTAKVSDYGITMVCKDAKKFPGCANQELEEADAWRW